MNWLYYLAEANIYLGVFYLAYRLFLTKETYYQLTRAYLLFGCVVSFILPVLQIGALKPVETAVTTTINYTVPEQVIDENKVQEYNIPLKIVQMPVNTPIIKATPTVKSTPVVAQQPLTPQDYLIYSYLTGAAILFLMLMAKIYALFKLIRNAQIIDQDTHNVVYLPENNTAFSFFNYLFIGTDAPGANTIIRHELVHIRQKHSVDIIFLELLKIINWFNPFVYLLQNSLKTVHEYIADEQTAASETDALTYSSFLVNNAYGAAGSSITHSFLNHNLLKKRIIMLNKQRSGSLARLKYLVALPICAAMLCASTLAFSKTYALVDLDPAKAVANITSVIRPKHNSVNTLSPNKIIKPAKVTQPVLTDSNNSAHNFKIITHVAGTDKPFLPFVSDGGYHALAHYLHKNIHYTPSDNDKGGAVVLGFKLDNDLKIADLKIVQGAGDKLDNMALDAFKNYKGTVNDDAGKYLEFTVYFLTSNYDIFKGTSPGNGSAEGAVLISGTPYKYNVTSKGYEYVEIPYTLPNFDGSKNQVWIFLKDGSYEYYQKDLLTDAQAATLKNKYGYEYPSNSYPDMEFLPATNGNTDKYKWTAMDISSHLKEPYTKAFYNHIYDNLKYPENEIANHKTSVVLVKFNLDQSGVINNVGIAKSGGADFDEAAVEAVKSFSGNINDTEGQHTIAIAFYLALDGAKPAISESFKKDGYVGDLAHGEHKSVFGNVHFTSNKSSENNDKK